MAEKEMRIMAKSGLALMLFSFIFAIVETLYFGSNWHPESKAEAICDNVAVFLCGYGCCLFMLAIAFKTAGNIKQVIKK